MTRAGHGIDISTLEEAVRRAVRAPSIHNTQPWRWHVAPGRVELHADPGRRLIATDPDGRDMLVSCGAALHHLRVALAGVGANTATTRLPDPERRDHLATVHVVDGHAPSADASLYAQIDRRRCDRRPYDAGASPTLVGGLTRRARALGADIVAVEGPARERILRAIDDAALDQPHRPGYVGELVVWTHRYAGARDGVPRTSIPADGPGTGSPHRNRFPSGTLPQRASFGPDAGTLFVVTTPGDDRIDRLRAGEAVSAVLLAAAAAGYASCPLSQALELSSTRSRVQYTAGTTGHPQLLLRIGRPPAHGGPVPETPRRSLSAVLF
ncbi:nitroreductase [Pseudonocardia dioxanivorans CB1190]|uniref:Nitroreductase n=1 Tax=Pseudonocardia dioxanivorans (strain ATCC 55486 / DSM 44775 / JCM 13855 / CB1190) TaxID=675635 RepID=F4CX09_PSEUX|nr:nitroreductase [Pseudonocardia dioxanivorans]AEA24640.1 nitroreductase [Pseudonocardia dioxanivorans CB1190]